MGKEGQTQPWHLQALHPACHHPWHGSLHTAAVPCTLRLGFSADNVPPHLVAACE